MTYVLLAYNTDSRYQSDIRYREYTRSEKRAEAFERIPRIPFTDSGHGIAFGAFEHHGKREAPVYTLREYVAIHMKASK